jgi:hypothetical protein
MNRWSNWKHSRDNRKNTQERSQPNQDSNNPSADHQKKRTIFEAFTACIHTKREDHQSAEERFWKRQIRVAVWLNVVTGIAAVAAGAGLIFVYLTLQDSRFATEEANRAWIAIRYFRPDNEISGNDGSWMELAFENIGKEPAQNVTFGRLKIDKFDGTVRLQGGPSDHIPVPNNTLCIKPVAQGAPLWPLQTGTATLDRQKIHMDPGFIHDFTDFVSGNKTAWIEGCISYVTFSKEHHSAFCFFSRSVHLSNSVVGKPGNFIDLTFTACPNTGTSFAD